MNKNFLFFSFLISIIFIPAFSSFADEENSHKITNTFSLGKDTAPITIRLFFAQTCPHCQHFFNDQLVTLQKEYIDTGKAKIIFHDVALNQGSMLISFLLHCQNHPYKFEIAKIILNTQKRWIYAKNQLEEITRIFKLSGYSDALINKCLTDKNLQTELGRIFFDDMEKYDVTAVPKLFINEEQFDNIFDITAIKNKLDSML